MNREEKVPRRVGNWTGQVDIENVECHVPTPATCTEHMAQQTDKGKHLRAGHQPEKAAGSDGTPLAYSSLCSVGAWTRVHATVSLHAQAKEQTMGARMVDGGGHGVEREGVREDRVSVPHSSSPQAQEDARTT